MLAAAPTFHGATRSQCDLCPLRPESKEQIISEAKAEGERLKTS